jgi:hypothetical protein
MMTVPSWLAFLVPAAFIAGMLLVLWAKRGDYDDGYTQAVADRRFPPSGLPDDGGMPYDAEPGRRWRDDGTGCPDDFPDGTCMHCGASATEPHRPGCTTRDELLPELPDWTGEQLRFIGDDDPGETTGPFDITSLDGLDERVAVPVRRDLALAFTDLPMPADASVLEQEWSWGKVAWQILEFRRWYADDSNWELAAA